MLCTVALKRTTLGVAIMISECISHTAGERTEKDIKCVMIPNFDQLVNKFWNQILIDPKKR